MNYNDIIQDQQYLLDKGYTQEQINNMTVVELLLEINKVLQYDKLRDKDNV